MHEFTFQSDSHQIFWKNIAVFTYELRPSKKIRIFLDIFLDFFVDFFVDVFLDIFFPFLLHKKSVFFFLDFFRWSIAIEITNIFKEGNAFFCKKSFEFDMKGSRP